MLRARTAPGPSPAPPPAAAGTAPPQSTTPRTPTPKPPPPWSARNRPVPTSMSQHRRSRPWADVWDIDKVAAGGDPAGWRAGRVPIGADASMLGPRREFAPRPGMDSAAIAAARARAAAPPQATYHDFSIQYDPANHRDVFYGAGAGGVWL